MCPPKIVKRSFQQLSGLRSQPGKALVDRIYYKKAPSFPIRVAIWCRVQKGGWCKYTTLYLCATKAPLATRQAGKIYLCKMLCHFTYTNNVCVSLSFPHRTVGLLASVHAVVAKDLAGTTMPAPQTINASWSRVPVPGREDTRERRHRARAKKKHIPPHCRNRLARFAYYTRYTSTWRGGKLWPHPTKGAPHFPSFCWQTILTRAAIIQPFYGPVTPGVPLQNCPATEMFVFCELLAGPRK